MPAKWPCYTLGPFTTITFEDTYARYISIVAGAQNNWQIASPSKLFFNQTYSAPNEIVTDSAGLYPPGNTCLPGSMTLRKVAQKLHEIK